METKHYRMLVGQQLKGATEVNFICKPDELTTIMRAVGRYEFEIRKAPLQAFVECDGDKTSYFLSKDFLYK